MSRVTRNALYLQAIIRAVLMDLLVAWALMLLLGIVHRATLVGGCVAGSTPVACAPAHSPVPALGYGLCVGLTFLVLIVTYPFRRKS